MEAFSLLKYWRGGGGGGSGAIDGGAKVRTATAGKEAVVAAVRPELEESDDENDGDDGPYFDLEFAVPDGDNGGGEVKDEDGCSNLAEDGDDGEIESDGEEEEDEREFQMTLSSSGSSGDRTDPTASLSPSDELFFKGRLVPSEPLSIVLNGSELNSKSQLPLSLLKSATKFRILMLKLKKSKWKAAEKAEPDGSSSSTPKPPSQSQHYQSQRKFFTVKLKVEEVPITSPFTRDSSSGEPSETKTSKEEDSDESALDEKRFSTEMMQKYLKMVKPLYFRVSRRYGDKLRFSRQLNVEQTNAGKSPPSAEEQKSPTEKSTSSTSESKQSVVTEAPLPSNVKILKQVSLPAGLRVVRKHLGKSRSASSAVAAAPVGPIPSKRRDDSLLQQQDGIQSAILHCKKSFNVSRDAESSAEKAAKEAPHVKDSGLS